MYNAIPMQKRWVYTAASLPHPTGLTFHEKGLHFRSDSSGSSLHGTGRRADVGVPGPEHIGNQGQNGFGLDTVVVHPERILHADKTLRDAT